MPLKRTRCLSTKLTRDEHAALQALAGAQRISEWARETLLTAASRHVAWQVVLAEIVALRTIVVNLHVALSRGETLSAEAIQRLIDLADREKGQRARALLEGARRVS